MNRIIAATCCFLMSVGGAAFGQVVVTFELRDEAGDVIEGGLVESGVRVEVGVLLAADEESVEIPDIRQIQFDLTLISGAADRQSLVWQVDDDVYLLVSNGTRVSASNLDVTPGDDLLTLMADPVEVMTMEFVVTGEATIDVLGPNTSVTTFLGDRFSPEDDSVSGEALILGLLGQPTEGDRDGDGVPDVADAFPTDPQESVDTDSDGIGNNADEDDDGDGVDDVDDEFPFDETEQFDTDFDGVGDNADAFPEDRTETIDSDGDGVGDNSDAFPLDSRRSGLDDGDFNTGPRAGGGLCGALGLIPPIFLVFGLHGMRRCARQQRV